MYNDVITLIKTTNTTDEYGDTIETISKREVFAQIKSVGMKESYEALAHGLKPECVFVLADYYDYDGEKDIEYNGTHYSVFRQYKKIGANELELVVTADGGT